MSVKRDLSEAKPKVEHTPTPWLVDTLDKTGYMRIVQDDKRFFEVKDLNPLVGLIGNSNDAAFIVRAVNAHEELLQAAKNACNVLAGLITGDLKEIRADSPALQQLRSVIAKAEGK